MMQRRIGILLAAGLALVLIGGLAACNRDQPQDQTPTQRIVEPPWGDSPRAGGHHCADRQGWNAHRTAEHHISGSHAGPGGHSTAGYDRSSHHRDTRSTSCFNHGSNGAVTHGHHPRPGARLQP